MAVTINADNGAVSGSAGLKQAADSTGVLALQTNGTTAVSISTGQVVTLTQPLPVASGGTGSTTNAGSAFALKGANSDITSLTGLTTALSLAQGGTAATSASAARTSLGLVIGTDVLAPTGSAASLTSFPTLNQSTTGNAATATGLTSSNYISAAGSSGNANTDFQNTTAYTYRYQGDAASVTNGPGGTWWFYEDMRHSNSSNYWGTQIAWGWEDNANKLATRNVTGGTFGSWVFYLNSSNYSTYVAQISFGNGQTWTVVTGSRAIGTTYTNSTGKPIFIAVTGYVNTGAQTITVTVAGATAFQYYTAVGTNARSPLYFPVPIGATYAVSGFNVLEYWSELR